MTSNCESLKIKLQRKEIELQQIVICGKAHRDLIVCCPLIVPASPANSSSTSQKVGEKSDNFCNEISKINHVEISEHIANGERADPGEFPHVVASKWMLIRTQNI